MLWHFLLETLQGFLDPDKANTRSYRSCVLLRSRTASLLLMSLITSTPSASVIVSFCLYKGFRNCSHLPRNYAPRCYLIVFCAWVRSGFKQYLLWEVFLAIPDTVFTPWFLFFLLPLSSMPFGFIMSVPSFLTRMSLWKGPWPCSHSPIMYHQHFLKVLCKSIIISRSYIFKVCSLGGGDGLVPK